MLVYVIVCPIITDMMQKYQSKKAACVYKARLRLFKFLEIQIRQIQGSHAK